MTGPQDDPRPALADRDVRPRVRTPSPGLSGLAIAALCAVLAIALFLILDANRRSKQQRSEAGAPTQVGILSPQPLALPPALPEPAQPPLQLTSEPAMTPTPMRPAPSQPALSPAAAMPYMPSAPLSAPPAPARAKAEGDDSPLIIDLGMGEGLGNASAAAGGAGDDQAVRASVIRNRANLVPQGSMISAVLETPIDSRRPGLVRAVVSRDARGFDGSRVLIPRGSRLIGEATGDVKSGQKRVLVNWTRLIRPDGVAIRIGSPAADVLGGAGIRGKVNNHVLERVTNAVLQSALTVGVNVASRTNSNNSVIVGLPGQVGSSVQNILPNVDSAPTIKIASGAEISVFVARDLDFSGTGLRR
jgi:type IV secretion system protein VirB10